MSYYDERCGEGTQWGCKRYIGNGEHAHVVRNARVVGPPQRSPAPHVAFHPACCPCVVDPNAVQPVGVLAEAAS